MTDQRHEDAEVHDAGRRNRRLDAELARRIGRPAPAGPPAGPRLLHRLAARPALPAATERELVVRAQRGDAHARGRLVEALLPLVASVAGAYRGAPGIERPELLQEGVVGLLRALERYDPDRGVPFWGYAAWWVRQAMQQLVAELTRPAVLSDRALRHLARVKDAHHAALAEDGREPGRDELARRSGLSLDQVDDLLAVDRAPRSLEQPLPGDDQALTTFGDLLRDPLAEEEFERVLGAIESDEVVSLLSGLSDRERAVLSARYGLEGAERTLREIAAGLGVSAERVRQIERRALGKLAAGGVAAPAAPGAAAP